MIVDLVVVGIGLPCNLVVDVEVVGKVAEDTAVVGTVAVSNVVGTVAAGIDHEAVVVDSFACWIGRFVVGYILTVTGSSLSHRYPPYSSFSGMTLSPRLTLLHEPDL